MPNGNIGTSLNTFMGLIQSCQLPPLVIKKLGLSFPSSRSRRCYGNVRFDYDSDRAGVSLCSNDGIERSTNEESVMVVSEGIPSERESSECDLPDLSPTINQIPRNEQTSEPDDSKSSSDTDSEPEEEWDRHEALHDDVDCQGRTKERLFENKIELKWEKGGSGLVFYTDAAYWDSLNGDFDEQTADDWDIDMGIYEKEGEFCLYACKTMKVASNLLSGCHKSVYKLAFTCTTLKSSPAL